jgi:phenylacetate-CoA ligase
MTSTASGAWTRPHTISAEELLAHDSWSRDQLLAYQHDRLRELIGHAISASPYYREVLGRDAADPDVRLEDLPILPKSLLMEQFDQVLADPRLRLAALEAHAGGPDPGALMPGTLGTGAHHVFCTSGTTGRRGVFPQTPAELAQWFESPRRVTARIGMPHDARTIGIGAPTPLHITQKLFNALGGWGDGRPRLTVTTPLPEIVQTLNGDQPEAIFSVAGVAGLLALEQLEGRLAIRPRRIVVSGEVLTDGTIERVREAWGIEPFEVYSCTEALFLGGETPERFGLHIDEDMIVLEVVDEHNRPVPPGVPGHRVLITSLVGRTLPLIRYELADAITLAPDDDASRLPYRRIARVDGRNDDVLRMPARSGAEAIVLPHRLRAPFARLPGVIQYQIVREPDRIAVRLVLRPDASTDTPERVAAGIRAALDDAGAIVPAVEIEQVPEIEREPGGAKLKLVKTICS